MQRLGLDPERGLEYRGSFLLYENKDDKDVNYHRMDICKNISAINELMVEEKHYNTAFKNTTP